MLYHLTITHTEDNCPVYQKEKMPEVHTNTTVCQSALGWTGAQHRAIDLWRLSQCLYSCGIWQNELVKAAAAELDKAAMAIAAEHGFEYDDVQHVI